MKILAIFCGRKGGNSECIAKAALAGAAEKGAEIEAVNLMDLDIRPCINCMACVRGLSDPTFTGKCPLRDDDMSWLDERILSSDGILFVAPMFEKAAPAPYKQMCDRMGPSHDVTFLRHLCEGRKAQGKETGIDSRWFKHWPAAFIGHGGSEWSQLSYPTLATPAVSLGMTVVDKLHFNWSVNLIFDDERMERVRRCGAHLAEMAALPEDQRTFIGTPGQCPMCHSHVFALSTENTQAECTVCGLIGDLKVNDGKIEVHYTKEALARSHMLESGRDIHAADLQQNSVESRKFTPEERSARKAKYIADIPTTKPQH